MNYVNIHAQQRVRNNLNSVSVVIHQAQKRFSPIRTPPTLYSHLRHWNLLTRAFFSSCTEFIFFIFIFFLLLFVSSLYAMSRKCMSYFILLTVDVLCAYENEFYFFIIIFVSASFVLLQIDTKLIYTRLFEFFLFSNRNYTFFVLYKNPYNLRLQKEVFFCTYTYCTTCLDS